jgi:hypothetical protein
MGFYLLPLIVLSFFLGIFSIDRTQASNILPPPAVIQAAQAGPMFVSYCQAVSNYQRDNPTFSGSVPAAALAAYGFTPSTTFQTSAGNVITNTSPVVLTCYAALPPGSLRSAFDSTDGDASLGIASGSSWSSYAGTVTALASPVPSGDVVYVVQP